MTKRLFPLILIIVGALVLSGSSAMAVCSPGKVFHTWDFTDYLYYYVNNYGGDMGNTAGAFWVPGARADHNEGTVTVDNWLRFYAYSSRWFISGNTGLEGVIGCPSGEIIVAISEGQGATASFGIGQADETPAKANHFNLGDINMTPIPRPQITNRSRVGDIVTLDMQVIDMSEAFSSRFGRTADAYISGINLYSFTGLADPGRDAAAWTPLQTVPYAGGVTLAVGVDVDCSDHGNDVFLAAGIEISGEYSTVHLGPSSIVECDPTLADPGDRFDLIRDRGKGRKNGRPFRER